MNRINRRELLKASAVAAAVASLRVLPNRAAEVVASNTISITFLERADVLICGSTLLACDLALRAARAGKRTVLAMERTNPFYEGISCLRSWIDQADAAAVPALLQNVIAGKGTAQAKDGRVYFNPTRAALDIEDALCAAGVRFYYNSPAVSALGADGRLAGVAFGGKPGLFAVESPLVLDCTPSATVARAAGAKCTPIAGPRRASYVVELSRPTSPSKASFTSSSHLKADVQMHHYYACFDMVLPSGAEGPFAHAEDFARVYEASLEFSSKLPESRFRGADAYLSSGADRLQCEDGQPAGLDNLRVFGPLTVPGNQDGQLLLRNALALHKAFPDAGRTVEDKMPPLPARRPRYELLNRGVAGSEEAPPALTHGLRDPGFGEPESQVAEVAFVPPPPSLKSDLIVAGGGTSGVAAAFQAGQSGVRTLCIDSAPELGGTNTVGGVTNLWFGNPTKAFSDYYKAVGAKNDGLNAPGFFRSLKGVGCQVLMISPICGVATDGRTLRRAYVATPTGLAAVEARQYIDATGDGSLAAWGGCEYTFGGERDEMTLWASFASFRPGKPEAMRQFLTPCDARSARDATRTIVAMRRNRTPQGGLHTSPPFYLAPRETRHIRGGKTVTYVDVLAGRKFADGVFRAISNIDTKGIASSDAAKSGFIPPDRMAKFEVTVPLAAMLPRGLDNLIIAGKAYSITNDALAMARMQRDMIAMGLVAGHAVAMVFSRGVPARAIPVGELQQLLLDKGVLRASDVAADDLGTDDPPEVLARRVAEAPTLEAALGDSAKLLLLRRDKALAALEPYAARMTSPLARLLCFLKHRAGIDHQLAELEEMLPDGRLPQELYIKGGTPHLLPDHGFAPLPALMMYNIARAGDARVLPLLGKVVERLNVDSAGNFNSLWGYAYALASSLERLAAPEGAALLKKAMAGKLFHDRLVTLRDDPRRCADITAERLGYLRLCMARALARCGDAAGCLELCSYLHEARVCYARCARAELAAVTGQDFSFNGFEWKSWIEANGNRLEMERNPS